MTITYPSTQLLNLLHFERRPLKIPASHCPKQPKIISRHGRNDYRNERNDKKTSRRVPQSTPQSLAKKLSETQREKIRTKHSELSLRRNEEAICSN